MKSVAVNTDWMASSISFLMLRYWRRRSTILICMLFMVPPSSADVLASVKSIRRKGLLLAID